jgi:hypothetical protein
LLPRIHPPMIVGISFSLRVGVCVSHATGCLAVFTFP